MANHTTKPKSNWTRTTSRHERGYNYQWEKARKAVLIRDSYLCQSCLAKGRPTPATEVHHMVAKAHGGGDEPENLISICHECHSEATIRQAGKRVRQRVGQDGWPIEK